MSTYIRGNEWTIDISFYYWMNITLMGTVPHKKKKIVNLMAQFEAIWLFQHSACDTYIVYLNCNNIDRKKRLINERFTIKFQIISSFRFLGNNIYAASDTYFDIEQKRVCDSSTASASIYTNAYCVRVCHQHHHHHQAIRGRTCDFPWCRAFNKHIQIYII